MKRKCSFCKITENKENPIISGKENSICRSCAETSLFLMDSETFRGVSETETEIIKTEIIKTPKELKKNLDKFVVGQEKAKKIICVSIYNHIQRINNPELNLQKKNILLIGNSGVGKTFLVETIAKNINIPVAIINTTTLTSSGYIGDDVSIIFERLWQKSDQNIEKAEKGIIFLDEIDKLRFGGGGSNNKDVSGRAVQQELLKMLENDEISFFPNGNKNENPIKLKTNNILFISGGAFIGLKEKFGVSINSFKKVNEDFSNSRIQELLENYGMIPEFIGRFPVITELEDITENMLYKLITEVDNNIIQKYKDQFKLSNIDIVFSRKFIFEIIKESKELKTGARAVNTIFEEKLQDFMFNIDSFKNKKININYKSDKVIFNECA